MLSGTSGLLSTKDALFVLASVAPKWDFFSQQGLILWASACLSQLLSLQTLRQLKERFIWLSNYINSLNYGESTSLVLTWKFILQFWLQQYNFPHGFRGWWNPDSWIPCYKKAQRLLPWCNNDYILSHVKPSINTHLVYPQRIPQRSRKASKTLECADIK